jgi:hypothetical protein
MQPYFLPNLGYFDLIRNSDHWIVFDTPQYIRHGWVNRNRILHPETGWQYIVAPVCKHARDTPIHGIRTVEGTDWRRRILRQLTHYRRSAPHYAEALKLVTEVLSPATDSLARLNVHGLEAACRRLDIDFRFSILSEMGLELDPVRGPGEWALRICQALGATEYVNPPGGEPLFDRGAFEAAGVRLHIRRMPTLDYDCPGYRFEPGLSIVDAMMWNRSETIRGHLERHRLR